MDGAQLTSLLPPSARKRHRSLAVAVAAALIIVYAASIVLRAELLLVLNGRLVSSERTDCGLPDDLGAPRGSQRIGVLVQSDGKMWQAGRGDSVAQQSLENKRLFSELHGYTLIIETEAFERTRPAAWSKLIGLRRHLEHYDWLLYLDADAVVMNPEKTVEALIPADPDTHLVLTDDWSGPNTGCMLVRRHPWTSWLLEEWFRQTLFLGRPQAHMSSSRHWPFLFEQRALHYMLQTPLWRHLRNPTFPGSPEDVDRHVRHLPQCALNSYFMHPGMRRNYRGQLPFWSFYDSSQYVDGDFILHFAGYKGRTKQRLFAHFLAIANDRLRAAAAARGRAVLGRAS